MLFFALGALMLGLWLVTVGLDNIRRDYLREIDLERQAEQETERRRLQSEAAKKAHRERREREQADKARQAGAGDD